MAKAGANSVIHIIDRPDAVISHTEVVNEFTGKYHVHRTIITGLPPSEIFYYQVLINNKVRFGGKNYHFIVPTKERKNENGLKILVLGDLQPKTPIPPLIQWKIMKQARKFDPDLFFFLGDHTNEGVYVNGWKHFYHLIGKIARNTPVLGVPGNHDTKLGRKMGPRFIKEAYKTMVNYPEPKSRYFITLYGLHVFAFDFHTQFGENSKNCKLFDKCVNTLDPKKLTFCLWHSSPFNTLRKETQDQRMYEYLIPTLNTKQKRNVIWLGGHEHFYQKFNVEGIYYLTSGATSSFHDHLYDFEHMEKLEMKFYHVQMTIKNNSVHVQAVSIKNKIIDDFSILIDS